MATKKKKTSKKRKVKKWKYGDRSLEMPGGKRASELTQSIKLKKGWVNIPTIDPRRGMSVNAREGLRMERKARKGKLKYYKTVKDAVKGAGKRSTAGGRYRKK